jgi:multiple sugar transport system permease protein
MKRAKNILSYTLLLLLAVSMLIPFLWMISTSLMGELEVYQFPPKLLPSEFRWSNFAEAMTLQPFWRFFLHTTIVAGASVAGQLLFCSMAAYAFARMRFKWRDRIFGM